jgi:hypothetical protein
MRSNTTQHNASQTVQHNSDAHTHLHTHGHLSKDKPCRYVVGVPAGCQMAAFVHKGCRAPSLHPMRQCCAKTMIGPQYIPHAFDQTPVYHKTEAAHTLNNYTAFPISFCNAPPHLLNASLKAPCTHLLASFIHSQYACIAPNYSSLATQE